MCHRTLPIAAALRLLGLAVLLTLLSLLCSPVSVAHAQSSDGLVGYWPFDEGSGTSSADQSGNGNTATLSTGADFTPEAAPVPLTTRQPLTTPSPLRRSGAWPSIVLR